MNFRLLKKTNEPTSLFKKIISHPSNFNYFKENKYLYRAIYDLCKRMPLKKRQKFSLQPTILFFPVTKVFACSVSPNSLNSFIFIFPDLLKKLSCVDNSEGLAILAHELGHLFHEHGKKKISTLEAQIEADDFAFSLGLGRELCEVLSTFKDIDSRTRLSYLTAKILTQEN